MAEAQKKDAVSTLFAALDKDGSGEITRGEMARGMMGDLKKDVTKQLGANFFYQWNSFADLHKGAEADDGKIDIIEFRKWVGDRQIAIAEDAKIMALFDKLDKDGSKEISKKEMVKGLMGELKTDVEALMGKNFFYQWTEYADIAEGDNDAKVGPGEFTAWVKDRQKFLNSAPAEMAE